MVSFPTYEHVSVHECPVLVFSDPHINPKRFLRAIERLGDLAKKEDLDNILNDRDPNTPAIEIRKYFKCQESEDRVFLDINCVKLVDTSSEFVLPPKGIRYTSLIGAILLFRPTADSLTKMASFALMLSERKIPIVWCEDKTNISTQDTQTYTNKLNELFELRRISFLLSEGHMKSEFNDELDVHLMKRILSPVADACPYETFSFSFDHSSLEEELMNTTLAELVNSMGHLLPRTKWVVRDNSEIYFKEYICPKPIYLKQFSNFEN